MVPHRRPKSKRYETPTLDRMAIAKGASVVVRRGGVERPGTIIREVAPHVVQGINPDDQEVTPRYEIDMPKHGGRPASKGVFTLDEVRAVPRDSRARKS